MSRIPVLVQAEPVSVPDAPPHVRMLSRLIEREPDSAVYYLLRGEEWLACGAMDAARADFEMARYLAAQQVTGQDWGYLYQAYVDRADAGLRTCGTAN